MDHFDRLLPRSVAEAARLDHAAIGKAADAIEEWSAHLALFGQMTSADELLRRVDRLASANGHLEKMLDGVLALRTKFHVEAEGETRRTALRNYLRTMSVLIDLNARVRLQFGEAVNSAAMRLANSAGQRERLIDVLAQHKSGVGASVMSVMLFDPPVGVRNRVRSASVNTKAKLLRLIAQTRQITELPRLARFVRLKGQSPELLILAADAIRRVGLPQEKRPGQDKELPAPEITPSELHKILAGVAASRVAAGFRPLHRELIGAFRAIAQQGWQAESYRLGPMEVRPGDWLLMRNPSPYNLFTNLSPGLFTHVGVVTDVTDSDGRRRMVLVDLPERGTHIPATNVETYVKRSRHYMFLRHEDPQAAAAMARTARDIIGNPSSFDLNFRTARVLELKGQPLKGKKIHTYCAGLLLLAARETGQDRSRFFPIPEGVAGGNTAKNIKTMGLSIGEDFISPTGALFSPVLQVAGRMPPTYEAYRQVEEEVFDHFADRIRQSVFVPSHNTYQALRLKVAQYAKDNPALAEAIRRKEKVGDAVDLEAAAKAQAVVEALDDIAYGASGDFLNAHIGLVTPRLEDLKGRGFSSQRIERVKELRQRHDDLRQRIQRITPRQLRKELVNYYVKIGKQQVDERFFSGAKGR